MAEQKSFAESISAILARNGIIKPEEAQSLTKLFDDRSKVAFDDFLLEQGLVPEHDLLDALSEYFRVPAVDVVGEFFKYHLLRMFPKNLMIRHAFIPYERDANILTVVASNPLDPKLLEVIGEHVSYDIQFRVGLKRDIIDTVQEFYDKAPTEVGEEDDFEDEDEIVFMQSFDFDDDDDDEE